MTGATDPDYDVVVVGGGGGGMAAALSAAEEGASVLLVEAAKELGGTLALSGGGFMAAGTDMQRAVGIADEPDDLFAFLLTHLQWKVEPSVLRAYCERAPEALAWLATLGADYPPANLSTTSPVETAPRLHRPVGGGFELASRMAAACRSRGIDTALANRVDELVVEENAVLGVSAVGESIRGSAVVLATGSFSQNRRLVEKYYPSAVAAAAGEFWSPIPETCVGDGLELALKIGASTAGFDSGAVLLSTGLVREIEPYMPGWLVFVNSHGRRFASEVAPYGIVTELVSRNEGFAWALFDRAAISGRPALRDQRFGLGSFNTDAIDEHVKSGMVLAANSIEGLARAMSVPEDALGTTIARYNADAGAGDDTEFFKPAEFLLPVAAPPYYAVKLVPMVLVITGFGVRIDPRARVLNTSNTPIPGLYAAGDVTGNVIGDVYTSGFGVGASITFGRVAGQSAARRALGTR